MDLRVKKFWFACCCGEAGGFDREPSAAAAAERHRAEGAEGCDHVTGDVEYRDPRLVPNERNGGRR